MSKFWYPMDLVRIEKMSWLFRPNDTSITGQHSIRMGPLFKTRLPYPHERKRNDCSLCCCIRCWFIRFHPDNGKIPEVSLTIILKKFVWGDFACAIGGIKSNAREWRQNSRMKPNRHGGQAERHNTSVKKKQSNVIQESKITSCCSAEKTEISADFCAKLEMKQAEFGRIVAAKEDLSLTVLLRVAKLLMRKAG